MKYIIIQILISTLSFGSNFADICRKASVAPKIQLVKVTLDNPRLHFKDLEGHGKAVLVASLMLRVDYEKYLQGNHKTGNRESWVTLVPDVQEFCRAYVQQEPLHGKPHCSERVTLRLNQYLGLRPDVLKDKVLLTYFVPLKRLFRPCYSPDTDSVDLVDSKLNPKDGVFDPNDCYPFTGMGYTYDWGQNNTDADFVGANEFIVSPKTDIFDVTVTELSTLCGC